jgi:hypothetical protein
MYRRSSKLLATLLLAFGASGGDAQVSSDVLLRVRVTDAAYTDYYPDDCPPEAECIAANFWFRYEANVREVVRGSYALATVRFANLQHTYFVPRHPRDWYVLVVPCGENVRTTVGVEYCVKDRGFGREGRERLIAVVENFGAEN